jgi:DNA end-binding protein Ku
VFASKLYAGVAKPGLADALPQIEETMPRPYWSGQLKISLVSFGIQLFPATNSSSEITFHQIDRETGARVHHLNVIDDDRPIEKSEIVKGYEYSKGKYLVVEPDEIANLRIESRKTLELAQFVGLNDIPLTFYEKPYFVVPDPDDSGEAFAVVREALLKSGKAGIGELAFGGREHLIAIAPALEKNSRELVAYTLRYGEELRKAVGYLPEIASVQVDKRQLDMAVELIRQYSAPLNLGKYKDDYEAALRNLIEAKRKKEPLPVEEEKPQRAKVVNLMDALRRSVDATKKSSRTETDSSKKSKFPPKKGESHLPRLPSQRPRSHGHCTVLAPRSSRRP